jgi:peptidoglycan/LPS O-acetylase OafA/YrhL
MSAPVKLPLHLRFLDGLRALAALYVMLHHASLIVWPNMTIRPSGLTGAIMNFLAFGHLAVVVFIVLSGFCLMLPVVRAGGALPGGAATFLKRRARRILPPYYLALGLSCILLLTLIGQPTGSQWDFSIPFGPADWIHSLATHLFLVNDFFDVYKLNGVFWSIAVEWQIYFLFPLLLIAWRRVGPLPTTLASILLSFTAAWATRNAGLPQQFIHFIGLFAMGMFAAQAAFGTGALALAAQSAVPWRLIFLIASASAAAICLGGIPLALGSCLLPLDLLTGVATIALMISACHPGWNPLRTFLSLPLLTRIGTFSYSLYLIHFPLLQLIWRYAIFPQSMAAAPAFALLALVGGPLVIFSSFLFFLVAERPFLNRPLQGN